MRRRADADRLGDDLDGLAGVVGCAGFGRAIGDDLDGFRSVVGKRCRFRHRYPSLAT